METDGNFQSSLERYRRAAQEHQEATDEAHAHQGLPEKINLSRPLRGRSTEWYEEEDLSAYSEQVYLIATQTAQVRCDEVATALRACGSPIERQMLLALILVLQDWVRPVRIVLPDSEVATVTRWPTIQIQPWLHGCRVDFLVSMPTCESTPFGEFEGEPVRMVVECDGYDWHSSLEAMQRDRERDQILQTAGFLVFRFMGRDIWQDPLACAERAVGTLLARC